MEGLQSVEGLIGRLEDRGMTRARLLTMCAADRATARANPSLELALWSSGWRGWRTRIRPAADAIVAPELVLPLIHALDEQYPAVTSKYGFKCSFNPTFVAENGDSDDSGWISEGYYGLDQGPIVVMIENYRSGLFWQLMRSCPYLRTGLQRAGFTGGWLQAR